MSYTDIITPQDRASMAAKVFSISPYDENDEPETQLADLLADLRHWANVHRVDFSRALHKSEEYYLGDYGTLST